MTIDTATLDDAIRRCRNGEKAAQDELASATYARLRGVARGLMRGQKASHTLCVTALVNEAFVRIMKTDWTQFRDARHYLRYASLAMRSILVDHAKNNGRDKRGGGKAAVPLEAVDPLVAIYERQAGLEDLDAALKELAEIHAQSAEILEMTYFGRFQADEVAEALGLATRTVERRLEFARSWLRGRLRGEGSQS